MMYATEEKALQVATANARITGNPRYVMIEDGGFDVCAEYDLGTFYLGSTPLYEVMPDGEVIA